MTWRSMGHAVTAVMLGTWLAGAGLGQEPAADTARAQGHNNVRPAIQWKQFDYTCEGGEKLTVYLMDQMARVRFQDHAYLMKQTVSTDGNRYSDGKMVWWGKGDGGFLQEDTPDGNGKMIVKDCKLDKPLNAEKGEVGGTVSYLQRIALPPNAVMQVQLLDVSGANAPAIVIAEEKIMLSKRQAPVPFTLSFDPAKIDAKHAYSVMAKITVNGKLWFESDQAYPVLTRGNPAQVKMILNPMEPGGVAKP